MREAHGVGGEPASGSLALRLPDGRTASFAEMQRYGEVLQQFVREQEARLAGIKAVNRHNEVVDFLHLLAREYNAQLRLYKVAEARRQQQLLQSLLRMATG